MRMTGTGSAELVLRSARKLADAGADFLICPDNTAHQTIDLIIDKSPLPWLHIASEVASTGGGSRLSSRRRARHEVPDGRACLSAEALRRRYRA